ncbi:SH3 domain-containing kinase-binding protein 1 isoform X2 [Denticeps clupeoides]|uniref:SH3 domain-containing kinase-binding protein 1 isoform X2 n=1 Tax=Denticeps clupeoides TaxID=299321 RepID=UPI0010A4CECE|nr:SH3 domain-containing kinase-binding protein 1-like isoform X2 [Denticeps clupeoides]
MGNYSSALTADIEHFDSIIAQSGKPRLHKSQSEVLLTDSGSKASLPPNPSSASSSSLQACGSTVLHSSLSLLSEALHSPASSTFRTIKPGPQEPPVLQQMKLQLHDLKEELDLLRTQHKKEIKFLVSELDEEKKVRLSLQMEVKKIQKQLANM